MRVFPIPGVERWLAAAGLRLGKVNVTADAAQNANHVPPDLRRQPINKAGNKQRNSLHL